MLGDSSAYGQDFLEDELLSKLQVATTGDCGQKMIQKIIRVAVECWLERYLSVILDVRWI
jgi:hypothetical protein